MASDAIDIKVKTSGAAQSKRELESVKGGLQGLERSTRGTLLPMLSAGLLTAGFAGGLGALVLSSGEAQNALTRLFGGIETLLDPFMQALYPVLDWFHNWIDANETLARGLLVLAFVLATPLRRALIGISKILFGLFLTPVGLITAAIFGLVAAVYFAATRLSGLAEIVNGFVDLATRGINRFIDTLNLIPGVNIGKLDRKFNLPSVDSSQPLFSLRDYERDFVNQVGGAVGLSGAQIQNNYYGLSPEEAARQSQTVFDSSQARARVNGGI